LAAQDVKRFFAFSSIEQSGIAAFAFGLGGATAVLPGLLHLTLHTLAKAAVFQCVGRASQLKGGQKFADIGGLLHGHRALGLTLAAGVVAVAGLPPFGLFASEFLIVVETVRSNRGSPCHLAAASGRWLALAARLIDLCLGAATPDRGTAPSLAALAPAWLHLILVLLLGLAMPASISAWFTAIATAAS